MLNSIDQCRYLKENGHRCTEPVRDPLAEVLLCKRHTMSGVAFVEHVDRLNPDSRTPQDRREHDLAMHFAGAQEEKSERVYYVQFRDRIKIGTTRNMKSRMGSVPNEKVLVTEPGGRHLEQRRHLEFRHCRENGEWFRADDPRLLAHIAELRKTWRP